MPTTQTSVLQTTPRFYFTTDEWHATNRYRYRCSEIQQKLADRLVAETKRICELTSETTKNNKGDTDHRLKEKLDDIEFRKRELLRIRSDVMLEIDAITTYKNRIVSMLTAVRQNVIAICEKCLFLRDQRLSTDLVHDDVERELLKEIKLVKESEKLLVQTLEQTQEQFRNLKARLYYMDRDIEGKESNALIDRKNLAMKENSVDLNSYDKSCLSLPTSTLNEWEHQTNLNIMSAMKEIEKVKPMRGYIDTMIKKIVSNLDAQKDTTNEAFRKRIEETKEAKFKLELLHSKTVEQIDEMHRNIESIQKALVEKERYMALAHARLVNRCGRPGLELTRDLVETSLLKEVHELRETVSNLQQTLCEAEASLRYLHRSQIQIEEDINVKAITSRVY